MTFHTVGANEISSTAQRTKYIIIHIYMYTHMGQCPAKSPFWALLGCKLYHYKNSTLNKTVYLHNGTFSFQISYTSSLYVEIDFDALNIFYAKSAKITNPTG